MIFINKPVQRRSPTKILVIGLCLVSVALIGAVAFGINQFNAQRQQVALLKDMTSQVEHLQSIVTRNTAPELLAAPVEAVAPVAALIQQAAAVQPVTPRISAQERAALVAEARATAARIKLERLTKGLIVGQLAQSVVDGEFEITSTEGANGATDIAFTPNNNPATAALIEQVIADSVQAGVITLPSENGTSDGGFNTSALLFDLVEQSLEAGDLQQQEAANQLRQVATEAAQVESIVIDGTRYYTVEPGDSLAYIALRFYGSTRKFTPIFEANSATLSSPDQIEVGQKLIIPQI